MTITKIDGRELTVDEEKTVHWYLDYLTPDWKNRMAVAVCDNGTIALIDKEKAPDRDAQLAEARRLMHENLAGPPDFSTIVYKDRVGEVTMYGGSLAKLIFNRPPEEAETGKLDFGTGYATRMDIILACESENIIALAENDKTE